MKKLYLIMLVLFTNILGAGVILPVLPLYAQGQFKGTIPQITLLASAFFGAQFLAAPWLGSLSDRYGRRPILMISQLGTVLAFIIFIFAGPLGSLVDKAFTGLPLTGGMLMLFAARILDGITGGNITTAQAYVRDITTEEERTQGLGLLQAAFGAGFVFGPALGGILSIYGPIAPFVGATIVTSITLMLTTFTLKESLPPQERDKRTASSAPTMPRGAALRERPLLLMLLIGFLASLAFASIPAIFSLFADHVIFGETSMSEQVRVYIGLMLAFWGLMQIVTQLAFLKPLVARLRERRALILGDIALALAFFGIASARSPFLVAGLLGIFSFGQGVSEPTMQSLMTRFGDKRSGGYLLGLYQSARSLALIFGPIFAGYIYSNIAPRAVFSAGGFVMLGALIGSLILLRMKLKPIPAMQQADETATQTLEHRINP